jgi:3-oxoacyl-[acyl-carrier-protein] synthase-1
MHTRQALSLAMIVRQIPSSNLMTSSERKKNTQFAGSGAVFQTMNSTVNMNLATIFKLKGINFTISAACASGSHSIGLGYMMIKHGYQERVICGGAQEINVYAMGTFDALGAFSVFEGDPTKALRPFDKSRDGLIPSGGAATVVIESLESAQKRGATILGEIVGYGFSSNGGHISNPTVAGPQKSLSMALEQAQMLPTAILATSMLTLLLHHKAMPARHKLSPMCLETIRFLLALPSR